MDLWREQAAYVAVTRAREFMTANAGLPLLSSGYDVLGYHVRLALERSAVLTKFSSGDQASGELRLAKTHVSRCFSPATRGI